MQGPFRGESRFPIPAGFGCGSPKPAGLFLILLNFAYGFCDPFRLFRAAHLVPMSHRVRLNRAVDVAEGELADARS
jgi:hypothetical protein